MEPDISYYLLQNLYFAYVNNTKQTKLRFAFTNSQINQQLKLTTITRSPEEIYPKTFKVPCLFYHGKFETVFEMLSYEMSSSALLGFWSPDFVATTLFHVKRVINSKFGQTKNFEASTLLSSSLLDKINSKT